VHVAGRSVRGGSEQRCWRDTDLVVARDAIAPVSLHAPELGLEGGVLARAAGVVDGPEARGQMGGQMDGHVRVCVRVRVRVRVRVQGGRDTTPGVPVAVHC
jgi:hypothetical protein